jgi:hypothetical protein
MTTIPDPWAAAEQPSIQRRPPAAAKSFTTEVLGQEQFRTRRVSVSDPAVADAVCHMQQQFEPEPEPEPIVCFTDCRWLEISRDRFGCPVWTFQVKNNTGIPLRVSGNVSFLNRSDAVVDTLTAPWLTVQPGQVGLLQFTYPAGRTERLRIDRTLMPVLDVRTLDNYAVHGIARWHEPAPALLTPQERRQGLLAMAVVTALIGIGAIGNLLPLAPSPNAVPSPAAASATDHR